MKEMRSRARQLKITISVYGLSRGSRSDHCAREGSQSKTKEWRVVSQCSGGAPSHYCSLVMFENSEVFFVSLSLLSLCFVMIIKYSRAQKRTQASYPHHHSFLLL